MTWRIVCLLASLVFVCAAAPDPALGAALAAAGAQADKYTCDCREVPSDDGIRTLNCHCKPKGTLQPSSNQTGQTSGTEAPMPSNNQTEQVGNATTGGTSPQPGVGGNGTQEPVGPANATVPSVLAPQSNATTPGGPGASGGEVSPGKGDTVNKDESWTDTTAYVICVTRAGKEVSSTKPSWDWLKNGGNKLTVPGKWTKVKCSYGLVDVFIVAGFRYNDVLSTCNKLKYDLVQPSNFLVSDWYAFEVKETSKIQPFFRRNSGWISVSYDKMKESDANKC